MKTSILLGAILLFASFTASAKGLTVEEPSFNPTDIKRLTLNWAHTDIEIEQATNAQLTAKIQQHIQKVNTDECQPTIRYEMIGKSNKVNPEPYRQSNSAKCY